MKEKLNFEINSEDEISEAFTAASWEEKLTMLTKNKFNAAFDIALKEVNRATGSTDIVLIIEEPTVFMYITDDLPDTSQPTQPTPTPTPTPTNPIY